MNLFNVFFNSFLALSTVSTARLIRVPPTKTPHHRDSKMLMVITTAADEFMRHLNIHLPTAYTELV